jgi:hypothetical protein
LQAFPAVPHVGALVQDARVLDNLLALLGGLLNFYYREAA